MLCINSVIHSALQSGVLSSSHVVMSAMHHRQESTMPVTFPTTEDLVNTSIQNLPATITIPSELFQERLQEGSIHGCLSPYLPYITLGVIITHSHFTENIFRKLDIFLCPPEVAPGAS